MYSKDPSFLFFFEEKRKKEKDSNRNTTTTTTTKTKTKNLMPKSPGRRFVVDNAQAKQAG